MGYGWFVEVRGVGCVEEGQTREGSQSKKRSDQCSYVYPGLMLDVSIVNVQDQ